MLITLSRRTAVCQSVSEEWLTGVAPLGTVSYRFNFNLIGLENSWHYLYKEDLEERQGMHYKVL